MGQNLKIDIVILYLVIPMHQSFTIESKSASWAGLPSARSSIFSSLRLMFWATQISRRPTPACRIPVRSFKFILQLSMEQSIRVKSWEEGVTWKRFESEFVTYIRSGWLVCLWVTRFCSLLCLIVCLFVCQSVRLSVHPLVRSCLFCLSFWSDLPPVGWFCWGPSASFRRSTRRLALCGIVALFSGFPCRGAHFQLRNGGGVVGQKRGERKSD